LVRKNPQIEGEGKLVAITLKVLHGDIIYFQVVIMIKRRFSMILRKRGISPCFWFVFLFEHLCEHAAMADVKRIDVFSYQKTHFIAT